MNTLFHQGHALLIGVGGDLPCTVKDVHGLYETLIDPERCAYPRGNVRVLTGEKACVRNIRAELQRLAEVIEKDPKGSTVIVYFSGHGCHVKSSASDAYYLIASGYNGANFEETTLNGCEFTELLESIRAERFLLLLDCCHAGGIDLPKAKGLVPKELSPEVQKIFVSKRGRVVLASSTGVEPSWSGKPYSAFTHSLLEAFCGEGNARRDEFVRVGDLVTYTSQKVPLKTKDRQHPVFDFSEADNFEIAYYGADGREIKSLPFGSFEPETDLAEAPMPYDEMPEGTVVNDLIAEDQEGPIKYVGLELSGSAEANGPTINTVVIKRNKGRIDFVGAKKTITTRCRNLIPPKKD